MATIEKFTVVRSGAIFGGRASVEPYDPTLETAPALADAHQILGVTQTASDFQEPLSIIKRGYVRGLVAADFQPSGLPAAGSKLWCVASGSIGRVSATRPSPPAPQIYVGTYLGGNVAVIDVTILHSLGELSNVAQETPVDYDTFLWRSATGLWTPEPASWFPTRSESSNHAVAAKDVYIDMDATGGARVVTLPAVANSLGRLLHVKKVDSSRNVVTVDGNGAETIDGATTFDLVLEHESITVICDGAEWRIL